MWKNPKLVLDSYCPNIVDRMWADGFQVKPFPPQTTASDSLHRVVSELYEKLRNSPNKSDVERLLRKGAQDIAAETCRTKCWAIVAHLYGCIDVSKFSNIEEVRVQDGFVSGLAQLVHCLVGSEERFLIGTRHNQALWVDWKLPTGSDAEIGLVQSFFHDIQYVSSEDAEFMEGVGRAQLQIQLSHLPQIEDHLEKMAELLEDAYYNQCYAPHPSGSFIRVCGVPGVESVVIKTKRGLRDKHYIDILALVSFTNGKKRFLVIDGTEIVVDLPEGKLYRIRSGETGNHGESFLEWLVALLYHDLVTAKDVMSRVARKGTKCATSSVPTEVSEELQWIYIPRKRRKAPPAEIRQPVSHRRSTTPHRVSGYKRKGNLTDGHRTALESFEEETGIEVLRWLPEGYTFVRPHISPAGDADVIQGLPRFIRRRIQDDIRKLLVANGD